MAFVNPVADVIVGAVDSHHLLGLYQPQVFYYDDFLGQTSLEQQKLLKNEDEQLLMLLDRVAKSERHRFLLTTREYILSQAKDHYERLARSRFDVRTCVVTLDKYSWRDRCKILLNHLYFSKLPKRHITALLSKGAHRDIVRHKNFSPRIIEWMTVMLLDLPAASDYASEFLKNLDEPQRLWEHAYSRQLSEKAKLLLVVMGTLSARVRLSDAKQAFEFLWQQRASGPQDSCDEVFQSALRETDGTFVKTTKDSASNIVVAFQNPSIRDFVEYRLRMDGRLACSIIERCEYFEQVQRLHEIMQDSAVMSGRFAIDWTMAVGQAGSRTLEAPTCAVAAVQLHDGQTRYEKVDQSMEQRVALILDASSGRDAAGARPCLDDIVSRLLASWTDGALCAEDLEDVLDAVEKNNLLGQESKRKVLSECCASLLAADSDLALFRAYADLQDRLPEPPESAFREFCDRFKRSAYDYLDVSDYPDSSSAHEQIDEVEDTARALGVDINWMISAAREKAEILREHEYDRVDNARRGRSGAGEAELLSDEEIDEMFNSLEDVRDP
jgi:hypothetical protein